MSAKIVDLNGKTEHIVSDGKFFFILERQGRRENTTWLYGKSNGFTLNEVGLHKPMWYKDEEERSEAGFDICASTQSPESGKEIRRG